MQEREMPTNKYDLKKGRGGGAEKKKEKRKEENRQKT